MLLKFFFCLRLKYAKGLGKKKAASNIVCFFTDFTRPSKLQLAFEKWIHGRLNALKSRTAEACLPEKYAPK